MTQTITMDTCPKNHDCLKLMIIVKCSGCDYNIMEKDGILSYYCTYYDKILDEIDKID